MTVNPDTHANNTTPSLMILGCGDIGTRLVQTPALQHWQMIGVRRSLPDPMPSGLPESFEYRCADITNPTQLAAILPERLDYLLVTMTPSERNDAGYEQAYVQSAKVALQLLQENNLQPKHILFVSSTSVYGQSQGEQVDENSPAETASFAGRRLLEAEAVYQASGITTTCVRFSGIYGPGRFRLITQALSEPEQQTISEPQFSNRIHIHDCVAVLSHLLCAAEKGAPLDDVYIATDSSPSDLSEVKAWLKQNTLDALPNIQIQPPKASPRKMKGYQRSSKRLSNQRLLNTGFAFTYPTYREGYRPVLDEFIAQQKQMDQH